MFILGAPWRCKSTECGGLYLHVPEHAERWSGLLRVSFGWGGGKAVCLSTMTAGITGAERLLEKTTRMALSPDRLCSSPCSLSHMLWPPAESFLQNASPPLNKELL